jgi:general secretion pathway protein J
MRRTLAGMTLLEVLVALSIFSLIATAGYSGLRQGISIYDNLQIKRQFWRQLDSVMTLIQQDLDQARNLAPRVPVWEAVAFRGAADASSGEQGQLLLFTRGGHFSLREGPISPYQRIAYHLRDGTLYRAITQRLNTPIGVQATEAGLLDGVAALQMRYLDQNRQWIPAWPLAQNLQTSADLPRAVELTLQLENQSTFTRVFHVGAPY